MNTPLSPRIVMEAASSGVAAEKVYEVLSETGCGYDTYAAPAGAAPGVIHAAYLDTAANAFPAPINQPDVPRAVAATFQAGWTGGDITIVGTDARDKTVTEVIADNPGATVDGDVPFKTITAISKELVGAGGKTVTIDTTDKLGLSRLPVGDVWIKADGVSEDPSAIDLADGTFTPTTAPNGAVNFVAFYPGVVE